MVKSPRTVVVGAGIVGAALADELTDRGWTDVTVVEHGPLFAGGGSTYHAPGLVSRTSSSRMMATFAIQTIEKLSSLSVEGVPCFDTVGALEVATTPERLTDLRRKHGWAEAWGIEAHMVDGDECAALHPLLDRGRILGGYHIPGDGLARADLAAAAMGRLAMDRGARFVDRCTVTGIETSGGRVTGVVTDRGTFPADVVVSAAGLWSQRVAATVGMTLPFLPLAHIYARTGPVASLAGARVDASMPLLRHLDGDLYFRQHRDRVGIGSFAHRALPLEMDPRAPQGGPLSAALPFTPEEFAESWKTAVELVPELSSTAIDEAFNGVFSFTPDGFPILGESAQVRGFWVAAAVWITHAVGASRALAEWLVDGQPAIDVHEGDLHRFERFQLEPSYYRQRSITNHDEIYDVHHPLEPIRVPRGIRVAPFHARQQELGAWFIEGGGWERPAWLESNRPLLDELEVPERDPWSARFWSPIAAAEHLRTRETVALFDMTPLKRIEVEGPGALGFLQRLTTNELDRRVGTVAYSLMLDGSGRIRGDITVARLGASRFLLCASNALDVRWVLAHVPPGGSVTARDVTPGTCGIGVWGPNARRLVGSLTDDDLSNEGFRYFRARETFVGGVPVTALRVSYVGELGWELYTTADLGLRLWEALWEAGRGLRVIAAGRRAFESLRLEKGYRASGVDMTGEHDPYEAGLARVVRPDKGEFLGRGAAVRAAERPPARKLTCLTLDEPGAVVMGGEPVRAAGTTAGYVTSAAYGFSIGRGTAYAWLRGDVAVPGQPVDVVYFGRPLTATVAEEPVFDPTGTRVRG